MRFGRSVSHSLPCLSMPQCLVLLVVASALCGNLSDRVQAGDLFMVTMDKAKLIKYPPNTETIIVGNPIIADVTMLRSSGLLVVTGKGFGETNLLLLDRAGTVLSEASLRVEPSDALLVVQRGADRETYACHPRCEPTVTIGDAGPFMTGAGTAITTRNTLAVPPPPTNGVPTSR